MYKARQDIEDTEPSRESAPEDPGKPLQPRLTEEEIDARYREAYKDGLGLGPEFEGWEREGVWPED